jgi:hypothetical protein
MRRLGRCSLGGQRAEQVGGEVLVATFRRHPHERFTSIVFSDGSRRMLFLGFDALVWDACVLCALGWRLMG